MEYGNLEEAYTISKISEMTGVHQNTIRSWEEKLEEAFLVSRDPQNNRFYTARHVRYIKEIQRLKEEDLPLSLIKKALIRMQQIEREDELKNDYPSNPTEAKSYESLSDINAVSVIEDEHQYESSEKLFPATGREELEIWASGFFSQLQIVLEEQKNVITQELENAKESIIQEYALQSSDTKEQIILSLEEKMAEHISKSEKIQSDIIETMNINQDKLSEAIRLQMNEWTIISKDEIRTLSEKKGIFKRLFGNK